jgi:hypothetical protein
MRRHVIRSFASVDEQGVAVRDESREESLEVTTHVRICVLLNEHAGRRVPNEQGGQAVVDAVRMKSLNYRLGDLHEAPAPSDDRKAVLVLAEHQERPSNASDYTVPGSFDV